MSESYNDVPHDLLLLRDEKESNEWDVDDTPLKRMKISDDKPSKKSVDDFGDAHSLSLKIPMKSQASTASDETQVAMTTEETKKCKEVLKYLLQQPEAVAFKEPVDPVLYNIPTYFTIIKHPMDLGTINTKLANGDYITKDDFAQDIRLTFNNATTFNHPQSDVYVWAEKLIKMFENRFKTTFRDKKKPVLRQSVPVQSPPPRQSSRSRKDDKRDIRKDIKKEGSSRRQSSTSKPLTPEEKRKIKEDLGRIAQNKDKLNEVLTLLGIERTSSKVTITLENHSTEKLRELQRVLKGKGGKDIQYQKLNLKDKMEYTQQQLQELKKSSSITDSKKQAPKTKKVEDSDSDSDSELSSSSVDSEEVNIRRMSKNN
ncbi:Bromodomain-containing factor [Entamoeba marina]